MIAILIYLKTGNHGNIRFGCAYQILAYVISVMLSLAWYSTQRKFNLNNTSGWNIWSLLQRDALFGVHALYSNRKLLIDDFERFHSISVSFHSRVSIVDTTKRGNRAVWHLISNWTRLSIRVECFDCLVVSRKGTQLNDNWARCASCIRKLWSFMEQISLRLS